MTTRSILLVLALVCFFIAAVGLQTGRINTIALGLMFMALAQLVT